MTPTSLRFEIVGDKPATQLLRPQLLLDPGLPLFELIDDDDGDNDDKSDDSLDDDDDDDDDDNHNPLSVLRRTTVEPPNWHWPFSSQDWDRLSENEKVEVKQTYAKARLFYKMGQKYVQLLNNRCEWLFGNKNASLDGCPGKKQIFLQSSDKGAPRAAMTICSQWRAQVYDNDLRERFKAVDREYQSLLEEDVDPCSPQGFINPEEVAMNFAIRARPIDRYYDAKMAHAKACYDMWFEARRGAKATWEDVKVQCEYKRHVTEAPFLPPPYMRTASNDSILMVVI